MKKIPWWMSSIIGCVLYVGSMFVVSPTINLLFPKDGWDALKNLSYVPLPSFLIACAITYFLVKSCPRNKKIYTFLLLFYLCSIVTVYGFYFYSPFNYLLSPFLFLKVLLLLE